MLSILAGVSGAATLPDVQTVGTSGPLSNSLTIAEIQHEIILLTTKVSSLNTQVATLKSQVSTLQGNITAADLAGTYTWMSIDFSQADKGPPAGGPGGASFSNAYATGSGTLTLNADSTYTFTGSESSGSMKFGVAGGSQLLIWNQGAVLGAGETQPMLTATIESQVLTDGQLTVTQPITSSATDNGTWDYSGNQLSLSSAFSPPDAPPVLLTVAASGRMLVASGTDTGGRLSTIIVIRTP